MLYEVIVKNQSGAVIYQSVSGSLTNIMTIREGLIKYFKDDNEWRGDYVDTIIVTVADTKAKICIGLKDLQVSFA